jgi:hypothetical protein
MTLVMAEHPAERQEKEQRKEQQVTAADQKDQRGKK